MLFDSLLIRRFWVLIPGGALTECLVAQYQGRLRLARKWSTGALPNPVADRELPEWS